jgi:hypothetical protein
MKVVRLLTLRTGRFYPRYLLISLRGWVEHSAAVRKMSMKNSKDINENRTRDLLACCAVPQLTAPPRGRSRVPIPVEAKNFLFSETSRPDETQPATCSTGMTVLPLGKSAGASCSVEADNGWSDTSTPHWRIHGLNRDKVTFSYLLTSISCNRFLRRHRLDRNTIFDLGCSQHTDLHQIFCAQILGTAQILTRNFGKENFKLPTLHGTRRFRSTPAMLVVPHPLYWLTKCSSSPCRATYLWQRMKLNTAQESVPPHLMEPPPSETKKQMLFSLHFPCRRFFAVW